jgi:gliding motility-associated-like protein
MKRFLLFINLFLTFHTISSQNLLTNGDFETGTVSGFNVPGTGYSQVMPPFTTTVPGQWAIADDPFAVSPGFIAGADHSASGPGNMMIVDGSTNGTGQPLFWEAGNTAGGSVCGLTPGRTYVFSYWIKSIAATVTNAATSADIRLDIANATAVTLLGGTALAPLPAAGWQKVTYSFVASGACVHIGLWNNNTSAVGNDFAIDDVALTPPGSISVNTATACQNSISPIVTFTANVPGATSFTYTINGGSPLTANIASGNTATVNVLTNTPTTFTYNLVSVTYGTAPGTTLTINQSIPVVISALPTASISGNVSICEGDSATITFTGTPNATVTYNINTDPSTTIVLNSAGTATVTNPFTVTSAFNLISVAAAGCTQNAIGIATVTVKPLQTVTITGDTTICYNDAATVTFTGTPNSIVTYTVNAGPNRTIVLNASGVATITNNYAADAIFSLVSVEAFGTPNCLQPATGTATITVTPLPTATISGTVYVCPNGTATIFFSGTPDATVTYTINNGGNQTILLDASGFATLTNTYATTSVFELVEVSTLGPPVCTQPMSGTATVNVVSPTATIFGNATILAGEASTLLFYGTPGATVHFTSQQYGPTGNVPFTASVVLDATGAGTYNIPYLSQNTTFNLIDVVLPGTPSCTVPVSGSATITVNLNTCAVPLMEVNIDPASTVCNPGDCIDLKASYSNVGSTNNYVVSTIPYCPSFPFIGGAAINANCDDVWAPEVILPFNFSFYGSCYDRVKVGSNGVLQFTPPANAPVCLGLDFCPWAWAGTIPNPAFPIRNAIYGVYQDTDIGAGVLADDTVPDAIQKVNYYILDTGVNAAPNRVFVANFNELPQFSCHAANGTQTSQIVLHEGTNIIEVFVSKRTPCNSWQGGVGVIGVQNAAGTNAVAAPLRNGGNWSATNEAWRFYPKDIPATPTTITWTANGNPIGAVNENPLHICPTAATNYVATVNFNTCGVPPATDNITITPAPPLPVTSPHDMTYCVTGAAPYQLNIDQNADILFGVSNAGDYIIKYYEDPIDAANDAPTNINFASDVDLQTFTFNTLPKTIYVRLFDAVTTACANIRPFTIYPATNPTGTFSYPATICSNATLPVPITENTPLTPGGQYTASPPGLNIDANTGAINPGSSVGLYTVTYTITPPLPCVPFTTTASVEIENCGCIIIAPSVAQTVCEDTAITPMPFDVANGVVTATISGGTGLPNGVTGTLSGGRYTLTGIPDTPGVYTFIVNITNPTDSCSKSVTITVNAQPNAGVDGSVAVCDDSTTLIDLNNLITGEQTGGTWTRDASTGGTFNAAAGTFTPAPGATTSIFTYTLAGTAPCLTDTSTVTVTIHPKPVAGTDGTTTVCETSTAVIDLYSLITGEQAGGVWTRNAGGTGGTFNAATGEFTPAVGATNSVFTYTVTGTSPCGTDTSTATVNINPQPIAGTSGNTTVCDNSTTAINLFNLITGEQTGGVWTRDTSTGGTFNAAAGTFTPAPGTSSVNVFTYTLTGTTPCSNATSTATVNINPQPNAGTDGASTVCDDNSAAINLFGLLTGAQTGGVWTRDSSTGGTFNAAAGTFAPAPGASTTNTFTYTLTGTTPCSNDASQVVITIHPQQNAGTSGTTTVCDSSTAAINLNNLITGEQTGGVWTRDSASTGGTFNAAAGTFTPATGASSVNIFTYTLTGVSPCANATSTATVNINPQPDAGTSGSTLVCDSNTAVINLFDLITGEQSGGVWTRDLTSTGGTFNAAAGTFAPAPGATTSTFTYTIAGTSPCVTDSSVATVNISPQATAGTSGNTTICDSSTTTINLFNLITGEQSGGVWTRDTTSSGGTFNAAAGTFTPAPGATTSTFTYTITGVAPCGNVSSVATVNINPQPEAGTNGSATVCDSDTTVINLFNLITGEQTGGVWTRDLTSTGGTFNAAAGTFTPAPGATSSVFTYTLTGIAPCVNDSSTVTITIHPQPVAGTSGTTTVCETDTTVINLFNLITGEQSGGVWTRDASTGGTFNAAAGTFTPAVGATNSVFTYTLTGTTPCVNATSTATVNINAQPVAGVDGNTTVCDSSTATINLANLITGEQPGGVWTRNSGGTGGTFNAAAGTFTPAPGATNSTFTYTVSGTGPCTAVTNTATVFINPVPDAGTGGSITVCDTDTTAINLFNLITGEQAGGVWTRNAGGSGGTFNAAAGTFTPASGATNSTFTYTVNGTAPCLADTSIATININPQPVAGTSGVTTVCETSTAVINLFNLITGEQSGGVWTRDAASTGGTFNAAAGTFIPAVGATTSVFTYTLTGTPPCAVVSSTATVNINTQPNAGTSGATAVCESDTTTIDLFSLITGEQAGGVWTRTGGTGGTFNAAAGTFSAAIGATSSTFTYEIVGVAPCVNSQSVASVTVNPSATIVLSSGNASPTVCINAINSISIVYTVGNGATGVSLTGNLPTGINGVFNSTTNTYTISGTPTGDGTFNYQVDTMGGCPSSGPLSGVITVNPRVTMTLYSGAGTPFQTPCLNTQITPISYLLGNGATGAQAANLPPGLIGNYNATTHIYTITGTVNAIGIYNYTVTTIDGCGPPVVLAGTIEVRQSATVVLVSAPQLADQSVCINEPIQNIVYQVGNGATGAFLVAGTVPVGIQGNFSGGVFTISGTTNEVGVFNYTVTTIGGCGASSLTGRITVNPLPDPHLVDGAICVDENGNPLPGSTYILDSRMNNNDFNFVWTGPNGIISGANSNIYEASETGLYTVTVSHKYSLCEATASATVAPSFPPLQVGTTVSAYFSDTQLVAVSVVPPGIYEYQLDNGAFQEANQFVNPTSGHHTITVRDKYHCGELTTEVLIIDFPRFFTPNGDGYNDFWNIDDIKEIDPEAKIYIFDRYGKLVKEISPIGLGWDGTMNTQLLPGTDYWFKVLYTDEGAAKEFKSHFSLKR